MNFLLCLICLLATGAIGNGYNKDAKKTNKDIIKFSHKAHKEIADCSTCHTTVFESTSLKTSLLPDKPACAACHDVEDDKNCTMCHYENKFAPLIQKKTELAFNHKFHISNQKLTCESCHKGLNDVDYSFESATSKPSTTVCTNCHNK